MSTSEELEVQLVELERLLTDPKSNNKEIILSHSLELWLSYSDQDSFVELLAKRGGLLSKINEVIGRENSYKALLLLINCTANSIFTQAAVEKGVVGVLTRTILDSFKRLTSESLKTSKSLLSSKAGQGVGETIDFIISNEKMSVAEREALLVQEDIKLSFLVLANIAATNERGLIEIVGEGALEFNTLLLFLDWFKQKEVHFLFAKTSMILLSISGNETFREKVIEKVGKSLFQCLAFCAEDLKEYIESYIILLQTLRNLTFENEKDPIWELYKTEGLLELLVKSLKSCDTATESQEKVVEMTVDAWLMMLTSPKAPELPFFKEKLTSLKTLEALEEKQQKKLVTNADRFEAIVHILESEHI